MGAVDCIIVADDPQALTAASLISRRGKSVALVCEQELLVKKTRSDDWPLRRAWSLTGLETGDVLDFIFEELQASFDTRRNFRHVLPALQLVNLDEDKRLRLDFHGDRDKRAAEFERVYGSLSEFDWLEGLLHQLEPVCRANRNALLTPVGNLPRADIAAFGKLRRRAIFPLPKAYTGLDTPPAPPASLNGVFTVIGGLPPKSADETRIAFELENLTHSRFVCDGPDDSELASFRDYIRKVGAVEVCAAPPSQARISKTITKWQVEAGGHSFEAPALIWASDAEGFAAAAGASLRGKAESWVQSRAKATRHTFGFDLPTDVVPAGISGLSVIRQGDNTTLLSLEPLESPLLENSGKTRRAIASIYAGSEDEALRAVAGAFKALMPVIEGDPEPDLMEAREVLIGGDDAGAPPSPLKLPGRHGYYLGPRAEALSGGSGEWYAPLLVANAVSRL